MKKLLVLVAALALVPAVLPAKADALTLGQRVSRLEGKLNCLRRVPVIEYNDFTAYGDPLAGDNATKVYATTANTTLDPTAEDNPDSLKDEGAFTGLDWAFAYTGFPAPAPDYWVLSIRADANNVPYPGCLSKFGAQVKPSWWGRPTQAQRMTRVRQLARAR
jgi:hypothetical protein